MSRICYCTNTAKNTVRWWPCSVTSTGLVTYASRYVRILVFLSSRIPWSIKLLCLVIRQLVVMCNMCTSITTLCNVSQLAWTDNKPCGQLEIPAKSCPIWRKLSNAICPRQVMLITVITYASFMLWASMSFIPPVSRNLLLFWKMLFANVYDEVQRISKRLAFVRNHGCFLRRKSHSFWENIQFYYEKVQKVTENSWSAVTEICGKNQKVS